MTTLKRNLTDEELKTLTSDGIIQIEDVLEAAREMKTASQFVKSDFTLANTVAVSTYRGETDSQFVKSDFTLGGSKVNSIWTVEHSDYDNSYIVCGFSNREVAEEFAKQDDNYVVAEVKVYDMLPRKWKYWIYGAAVFPDGEVDSWVDELTGTGPEWLGECDDELNKDGPWDGHTQQHCGEHISIFGVNEDKVRNSYEKILAAALKRCDGKCHSKFRDCSYMRQRK